MPLGDLSTSEYNLGGNFLELGYHRLQLFVILWFTKLEKSLWPLCQAVWNSLPNNIRTAILWIYNYIAQNWPKEQSIFAMTICHILHYCFSFCFAFLLLIIKSICADLLQNSSGKMGLKYIYLGAPNFSKSMCIFCSAHNPQTFWRPLVYMVSILCTKINICLISIFSQIFWDMLVYVCRSYTEYWRKRIFVL